MEEEKIDIFDSDGNKVESKLKSEFDYTKDFHRVSLILPKTAEGKIILSKRSAKEPWPNTWVCAVGGKVSENESPEDAGLREMLEESGFEGEIEEIGSTIYSKKDYNAIFHIFITKDFVEVGQLVPDQREVEFFKDFTLDEISEMIEESPGEFANTFLHIFNEVKDKL